MPSFDQNGALGAFLRISLAELLDALLSADDQGIGDAAGRERNTSSLPGGAEWAHAASRYARMLGEKPSADGR